MEHRELRILTDDELAAIARGATLDEDDPEPAPHPPRLHPLREDLDRLSPG